MDIAPADAASTAPFVDQVTALIWSTGPVSYEYHFGRREVFDSLVRRSWQAPGTLFGLDAATLALEGDQVLGIEIGFHGPEFRQRQAALAPLWPAMVEAGEVDADEIPGILERSRNASWLNPVVRQGIYYIHAIAVDPKYRGKQIGQRLLMQAMDQGRALDCRALELDVLSDNPAVGFYTSQGLELLVESRAPKPEAFGVPPEWRMGVSLRS
ncbi:MAG: GNAT family N-acetyltransferase [Pseudomonadota bacterium]